jgi:YegS/Rv2252/BmrU family lipid kinase
VKAFFIINPNSAGGKTGMKIQSLKSLIQRKFESFTIAETTAPGHASSLTKEAIHSGYEHIFSVGGDGTFNEVVNGYLFNDKPLNPSVCLSILPAGTGGDFRRSLNIQNDIESAIIHSQNASVTFSDCGKCVCKDASGNLKLRYFDNVASLGLSDKVAETVNNATQLKKLGGTVAFLLAGIAVILQHKPNKVEIQVDDTFLGEMSINLIAIANGTYFGGGMKIAPHASLSDGLFDVIILENLNRFELLSNNSKIYYGGHLKHKKVKQIHGKKIHISSKELLRIETDGEPIGFTDATFEILPGVLKIK